MAGKTKIALCLEYPLALRGGVSVLVEALIEGLSPHYELVLVSDDTPESLAQSSVASLISAHQPWKLESVSREASRKLAASLAGHGVRLAHFHSGGNFGWGNRIFGQSPISFTDRLNIVTCSTVHLVTSVLDGYCGPQKPLLMKLALLPPAWCGKMQCLSHVRREIAVSEHDCAKLRRWYWPLQSRFRVIYHSRIRQGSRPTPVPREQIILNVGHIAWRKGQALLAEAFAQIAPKHPEWKLCLVGHVAEELEEGRVREIARKHGLEERIIFTGKRDDAFNFMNRAGIYVQPSFAEALGLALQEAMFCGCPSIGTRIGGIPELITDGKTGLLVDAGKPDLLAKALDMLITDSALREKLGRAGAASIIDRGMTQEQMVANHLQLYESLLQG